ncbi:MAG TPA: hypothetical protein PKM87_03380 [Methanolinea sp.]|nr:hypothetical protein [Methanolinea sp.]
MPVEGVLSSPGMSACRVGTSRAATAHGVRGFAQQQGVRIPPILHDMDIETGLHDTPAPPQGAGDEGGGPVT